MNCINIINNHKVYRNNNIPLSNPLKVSYNFRLLREKINQHSKKLSKKRSISSEDIESGFKGIFPESNVYTMHAPYVKNKKMMIAEKYHYDGNFQFDRVGKFDMKNKLGKVLVKGGKENNYGNKLTLYSTINFRRGKVLQNTNEKLRINEEKNLLSSAEKNFSEKNFSKKNSPKIAPLSPSVNSIYMELNLRKKEILNKYFKRNHRNNSQCKDNFEAVVKKNDSAKNIIFSNKTKIDNIPLTFPITYTSNYNYNSSSEQSRFEKLMNSLLKVKYMISFYTEKNKFKEHIIQFLLKENIPAELINEFNIIKIKDFLEQDTCEIEKKLNPSFSSKENIMNIILNKKNKDSSKLFISQSERNIRNRKVNYSNTLTFNSSDDSTQVPYGNISLAKQQNYLYCDYAINEKEIIPVLGNELKKIAEEFQENKLKVNHVTKKNLRKAIINKDSQRLNQNEKTNLVDLRLGKYNDEYYENYSLNHDIKPKKKISDINERLYYSNFDQTVDLDNIKRKKKLTEYIILQRIIQKNNIKQAESDSQKAINVSL